MRKILEWVVWFGDEIARRVVYLAGFFVLVFGAMSWIASYITPIAQYGWGAVLFAGIGGACIITLVGSVALVAVRYFKPLTKQPATSSEKGHEAPARDDMLLRITETECGIAKNRADLVEFRTRVAMLTNSLRARDAESIIKEADHIIMPTSERLLKEPYPDEAAWAADYAIWERAMTQIDYEWQQWQPYESPFLNIRPNDLEAAPAPLPQSPVQSYANVTRYKKMCLAQQRYADRRDDIFQYFSVKAGQLPR